MKNDHIKTSHARARQQQRAISDISIRLIQEFGIYVYQQGGCEIAYIERDKLKSLRAAIDNLAGIKLVIGQENRLVTAMHGNKKPRTTRLVA